jgi:hypothetical protein
VTLDRQQRDHFSAVVRPDFDRRIAAQFAKRGLRRGGDEPFDWNLAGQHRSFVNQVKMARFLRLLFAQSFERNADGFAGLSFRHGCSHQFRCGAHVLPFSPRTRKEQQPCPPPV